MCAHRQIRCQSIVRHPCLRCSPNSRCRAISCSSARNVTIISLPIGTGPFLVAEWQPGKLLKLAANEESWAGRPFVDAIEIEFGKSLRDQAIALELDKADVIEAAPAGSKRIAAARHSSHRHRLSLPVELLALVFSANSKAQDPRLREALALAIDRKPIQSVLLKGAGEPAASILPNWMTGYSAVFSSQANPQRARTLLAGSRQPALNLSYDPRDPQAQLIAERIALNAREVGITMQVSLSGAEDIRLVRVVLPSPDPATSLGEAARQLGLPASPAIHRRRHTRQSLHWTICIKPSAVCSMDTPSSRFSICRWQRRRVPACAAGNRIDWGGGARRDIRSGRSLAGRSGRRPFGRFTVRSPMRGPQAAAR